MFQIAGALGLFARKAQRLAGQRVDLTRDRAFGEEQFARRMREAFVPRGGLEGEQRAHVRNAVFAHVDSRNASSVDFISLYGARGRSNNYLLDGTDMNDGYRNDPAINEAGVFGTPATILPVASIAELHVASNFEAEYGRSAGAVVNIVTKSGTNQYHGTASEFFRNNALDARNFFNNTSLRQQAREPASKLLSTSLPVLRKSRSK